MLRLSCLLSGSLHLIHGQPFLECLPCPCSHPSTTGRWSSLTYPALKEFIFLNQIHVPESGWMRAVCRGKVWPKCNGGCKLVQNSTSQGARSATGIVRGWLKVIGLTIQLPWGCCLKDTFVYECINCKSYSNSCCFEEDSRKDRLGVRPNLSADGFVIATLDPSFRAEHIICNCWLVDVSVKDHWIVGDILVEETACAKAHGCEWWWDNRASGYAGEVQVRWWGG